MIFKGAGVALVTPFSDDLSVNYTKLEELIEFQIKNNTDALVICGTTGESATLSIEEKKKIFKFAVSVAKKRVPVLAGSGTNDTNTSIELSKYAESIGMDGLLLVTPYYNKCSQEGLFLHYKKIANSVTLPCILYNVPARTCVNILPETLKRLTNISNIVGLKDASSNIEQIIENFSVIPNDFSIYSGNDAETYVFLSLGGHGVISVASNIIPNELNSLCKSYFEGDTKYSKEIQMKYLNLMKNMFIDINPIPIKEAMNLLGMDTANFRLPLSSISNKNKDILIDSLKAVNLI